ncbi:MAG: hypothetical protein CL470_06185 [Acidimicrobiaceae bacterium]|nr:hypothetical protein [Acidimicrobiaceae bacterium]
MPLGERPLIVMAMEAEAAPVRSTLNLETQSEKLHPAFTSEIWESTHVCLALNGQDQRYGVDSIASQPAAITSMLAIERVRPSLVISAGTAGGFVKRGGHIGQVCLADSCYFHDRRIQLEAFEAYGNGNYPVVDLGDIGKSLGFQLGAVSTGNALDATEADLVRMDSYQAIAKDMEAASVAWICEQFNVPFTALKAITDLVDSDESTAEQFVSNFEIATQRLSDATKELIELITTEGEDYAIRT